MFFFFFFTIANLRFNWLFTNTFEHTLILTHRRYIVPIYILILTVITGLSWGQDLEEHQDKLAPLYRRRRRLERKKKTDLLHPSHEVSLSLSMYILRVYTYFVFLMFFFFSSLFLPRLSFTKIRRNSKVRSDYVRRCAVGNFHACSGASRPLFGFLFYRNSRSLRKGEVVSFFFRLSSNIRSHFVVILDAKSSPPLGCCFARWRRGRFTWVAM